MDGNQLVLSWLGVTTIARLRCFIALTLDKAVAHRRLLENAAHHEFVVIRYIEQPSVLFACSSESIG